MLPAIEQRFGCGGTGRRSVFGKSSGGYGAITHALRHSKPARTTSIRLIILSEVAVLVAATCSVPQLYNWVDRPTDLSPYYNRHFATLSYWQDEDSLIHLPNLALPP